MVIEVSESPTLATATRLIHFLLATAKSFWGATVSTAWGMATFLLLAALLGYYELDGSTLTGLFTIIGTLMENWQLVWGMLFLFELFTNFKELDK